MSGASDGLARIRGVSAVVFDMDGTLVDSEGFTAEAIATVLGARGLTGPGDDDGWFQGQTWSRIAARLAADHPELDHPELDHPELGGEDRVGLGLADALQAAYQRRFVGAPLIAGAEQALRAASAAGPAAIATSGNRESLEQLVARLGVGPCLAATVCAEDCRRSKPDPECYLLAAERLGVPAGRCLAFEDSLAGLTAARAAGMRRVAVLGRATDAVRERVAGLADAWVEDFTRLPAGFFEAIYLDEDARSDG